MDIYKIIACPVCKNPLSRNDNILLCKTHGSFPITQNGIPVLFSDSSHKVYAEGQDFYSNEEKNRKIIFLKKKLLRKPKLYFGDSLHDKLKKQYIYNSSPDKIILNIGSGHEERFQQSNMINFDIYPHWNTHVSGDAHSLPFLDNSVDIIWLCAVLEHIQKPFVVIDEIYRVLKPNGIILISVPFIQYLHASPHDYFRYTKYGLRSLCSRFIELDSGASFTGPFGTLIQLTSIIPLIIFSQKYIRNILSIGISWILSPLIVFDYFFRNRKDETLTGGVCYLGMKKT